MSDKNAALKQLFSHPDFSPLIHDFLHELATPITIVSLNLDLLQSELKKENVNSSKIEMLLERINDGSQRLQDSLKQMRDAAHQ